MTRSRRMLAVAVLATVAARTAFATDIAGVLSAALDQPRINAYISTSANGAPLADEGSGSFNIQAYYDTGASGVLLSNETAALLGLQPSTFNGQDVIFSDVGVAGTDDFYVSNPIHISLAKYHPSVDVDNIDTYQNVYNQRFGPIRAQIGPAGGAPDPTLENLDVFGMPTMAGKVIVMDARPTSTFLDTMRTYVYEPGTPFNAGAQSSNPGIPAVDRHIKLSYVNFDRFTQTTPAGAPGPSLRNNPFIGANPFVPGDTTPKVRLELGNKSTEASFLLDTGAAASIISTIIAGQLGVSYDPATVGTANPVLLLDGEPIDSQFTLPIGGIGGSRVVAGFNLSSLLLRTEEGVAANLSDPNHIKFLDAPVLVSDISVMNPDNANDKYTLDGIFGMNFLVASAGIAGVDATGFPLITGLARSKFDWATFDEPAGKLGLKFAPVVPQGTLDWFGDLFGGSGDNWDEEAATFVDEEGFINYTDGDHVRFGTVAFSDRIRLPGTVVPGSVLFDNDYDEETDEGINYELVGNGKISGATGLIKRGSGEVEIRTSNDYTGATVVEAGRIAFFAPQDIGPLSVSDGAEVTIISGVRQSFRTIDVHGTMNVLSGGRVVTAAVAVDATTGRLDLTSAELIVDYEAADGSPIATLRSVLANGFHNGAQDGHGLVSSTIAGNSAYGLGYIEASKKFSTFPVTWNGESIDASAILVMITRRGDTNLDGLVNFTDLLALAQNYGQTTDRVWSNGDSNYDGATNFSDLLALAQNYGSSTAFNAAAIGGDAFAADWALAQSLVPEPGTLAALALAPGLLRRKRR